MPINRLMKYENVYGPFNLPNGTSTIYLSDTKFYHRIYTLLLLRGWVGPPPDDDGTCSEGEGACHSRAVGTVSFMPHLHEGLETSSG